MNFIFAEPNLELGTWCWTRTNITLRVKETYHLSTQPGIIWWVVTDSNCLLAA